MDKLTLSIYALLLISGAFVCGVKFSESHQRVVGDLSARYDMAVTDNELCHAASRLIEQDLRGCETRSRAYKVEK